MQMRLSIRHAWQRPTPKIIATIAVILSSMVFALLAWNMYRSYCFAEIFPERYLRVEELREPIIHLDEVRSTSDLSAATSEDSRWETRYCLYEPHVNAATQEAPLIAPSDGLAAIRPADTAKSTCINGGNQVFALARTSQRESAQAIVFSTVHNQPTQVYVTETNQFISMLRAQRDTALQAASIRPWLTIAIAIVGGAGALGMGLWLVRALARERQALHFMHEQLALRNDQLAHSLSTWNALRINLDLPLLLQDIVQAAQKSLGFQVVVLNIVDPEHQHMHVRAQAGLDAAGQQMLADAVYAWSDVASLLQERFRFGQCYFIPQGAIDWTRDFAGPVYHEHQAATHAMDATAGRWQADDALLVPIELRDGQIAGVISVDYPHNQKRPSAETLQALAIFSSQAAIALENAQVYGQLQQELIDRTNAMAQLAVAKDAADTANQAKSAFLANMSHELRTPLTAMLGYSELLMKEMHLRGIHEYTSDLTSIQTAGQRLLTIVNATLEFAQIDAGKVVLQIETFAVAELADELLLVTGPLALKNDNTLTAHCTSEVGTMYSDRSRIKQVLLHVLANAAKFTQHGSIALHSTHVLIAGQKWLRFDIVDTGIGIPATQLRAIFQEFARVENPHAGSASQLFGGAGLGLAISQRFCDLLGGTISVMSEPGRGSTFTVLLPAVAEAYSQPLIDRAA